MNGPYPPMPPPNGMHAAGPGAGGPSMAPPHFQARPPMMPSYSTSATLQHRIAPSYPPFNGQVVNGGPPIMGNGNNSADTRTQLFVSNLPFRVRWQDLKDLMRKCGTVLRADVALNPADGRSRGFGVVLFAKAEDAAKAIATYHGYTWQTRVLDVRIDAQDPTGALALAEANRQQALQQQQKQIEHVQQQQRAVAAAAMARQSPSMTAALPPPPPPPPALSPSMQPGSSYNNYGSSTLGQGFQNGHASGSGSSPRLSAQPSPALSARNQPLQHLHQQHHSGSGEETGSMSAPAYLTRSSSQDSRNRSSPLETSTTPTPSSNPNQQQPSAPLHPNGLDRYASDSLLPSHLQPSPYEQARIPPPPPPPLPPPPPPPSNDLPPQLQQVIAMQQQQQQQPLQQPVYMPMLSVHPMGYAVPGGMLSYYSSLAAATNGLARPGSAPPLGPNGFLKNMVGGVVNNLGPGAGGGLQYQNRHLFIGNLPFNCQWQELKDLMRGAGNVLRADIAQGPDGRSRGFGSVLFATPQDAERAVALFNGHEFNGRMLKVHFDKFAGAGVNNQPPSQGPPPPPVYATANGQQPSPYPTMSMPVPLPHRPALLDHSYSSYGNSGGSGLGGAGTGGSFSGPSPLSNVLHARPHSRQEGSSRPGTASGEPGNDRSNEPPVGSGASGEVGMGTAADEGPAPQPQERSHPTPRRRPPPFLQDVGGSSSFSRTHHHSTAPSRIAMPPPLPFAALGLNGTPTSGGPGPFSPLGAGGMTPSMPAFTFGGAGPFAAQATPPLLPHGMFSPGVGVAPFSPGAPYFPGTPPLVWSSLTPGGAVTPGHGFEAFNPMFPPTYGYENMVPPISSVSTAPQQPPQEHEMNGEDSGQVTSSTGDDAQSATAAEQPSYFPPVPTNGSDGTNSPSLVDPVGVRPATSPGEGSLRPSSLSAPLTANVPTTVSAPPASPRLGAGRPRVGGQSKSDDAIRSKQNSHAVAGDEEEDDAEVVGLEQAFDALQVPSATVPARKGHAHGTNGSAQTGGELGLGWAEGAVSPAPLDGDVPRAPANGRGGGGGASGVGSDRRARSASFDGTAPSNGVATASTKPAAFGTSIWGS
ncbi:hypothetical protein JCM10908_000099 [Rhodotorula pacifica]|uniref:uncharacterized protein n=1 Tax=Rhodotorula pacifica TaxID=1495444 RepID=UPI00317C6901